VRPNVVLTVTSLLSMLLFTFHLSDDIVRGFEPGGFKHLSGMLTLILWLYATLVLADRWPRYTIILLASLLTSLMPLAHMRGAGLVGGRVAGSSGMHFWVWTLLAVGVTAGFSAILSARELWRLRGSQPR
jgi:hypothetical protein